MTFILVILMLLCLLLREKDRPKFIDCSDPVVTAAPYQKNIRFECDIQAVPAVNDVRVKFGTGSLAANSRDGHYHVQLTKQPKVSVGLFQLTKTVCCLDF
jgi:hypothetical protein